MRVLNENKLQYSVTFFPIVQSHTNIPRNQEIRMKTKILPYPQNQVEFIQQSGNKLHD